MSSAPSMRPTSAPIPIERSRRYVEKVTGSSGFFLILLTELVGFVNKTWTVGNSRAKVKPGSEIPSPKS